MYKIICTFFFILALFCSDVYATTYYVDYANGNDANWTTYTCSDIDHPCKYLNRPNYYAVAGDTIYLRGGTYYVEDSAYENNGDSWSHAQGVRPKNSGNSSSERITYSAYTGETVIVQGSHTRSKAVMLSSVNYIKVQNISFTKMGHSSLTINASHYNEISNCTFGPTRRTCTAIENCASVVDDSYLGNVCYALNNYATDGYECAETGEEGIELLTYYTYGSQVTGSATHNYIHDSTFYGHGYYTSGSDGQDIFDTSHPAATTDETNYNTIEKCTFYAGGHHTLGLNNGKYNVLRNTTVRNEAWWDSLNHACATEYADTEEYSCNCPTEAPDCCSAHKCGYRVLSLTTGNADYAGSSLVENVRISHGGYGGANLMLDAAGSGITIATPNNIIRYNDIYANNIFGARFGASMAAASQGNKFYNNTLYRNGFGPATENQGGEAGQYNNVFRASLYFKSTDTSNYTGVAIKNNLFHGGWTHYHTDTTAIGSGGPADTAAIRSYMGSNLANNCEECVSSSSDIFTSTDVSDPTECTSNNSCSPNLSLKSTATSIIDHGSYLTLANGSGLLSTELVVQDAKYFQDGTWGSDLARGSASNFYADWICVGTVSNCSQISSINYDTSTINLLSELTWNNNDPVWLYKKSDGTRVLYGSAPDIGAHERSKQKFTGNIMVGGSADYE